METKPKEKIVQALVNSVGFQAVAANYLLGSNDAWEQAAKWVEHQGNSDPDARVREFAANMAMSLRAHIVRL
jgi:hypothetical protein